MEQPLLSGEARDKKDEGWRSYQHVDRSASVHVPSSATGGEEVSVDEIRTACIFSEPIYPPSMLGSLVFSPELFHHQAEL